MIIKNLNRLKRILKLLTNYFLMDIILKFSLQDIWGDQKKILVKLKRGYKFTLNQLVKWNVKFNKLIMGKPSYDIFIDDKAFGFKKTGVLK